MVQEGPLPVGWLHQVPGRIQSEEIQLVLALS